MKNLSLTMGYEIKMNAGSYFKPTAIKIWDQTSRFSEFTPQAPFKYMNDALVGIGLQKMNQYKNLPFSERTFAEQCFKAVDPYAQLYKNSNNRLKEVFQSAHRPSTLTIENFEKNINDLLDTAMTENELNLNVVPQFLNTIKKFEQEIGSPLIYNFSFQLSEKTTEKILCFYSVLFHLRTLVALDYNAHAEDSAFECVKCDSISDYLPKADFTVNDALMYWQFKKLSTPFIAHKDKDVRIEKLLIEPLQRSFNQYNHNACALIENLPQSLLTSCSPAELEEVLHHTQMDWLLGSSAGLVFRLREELFGLEHGYDKVFWPEATPQKKGKPQGLKICFELNEQDIFGQSSAA